VKSPYKFRNLLLPLVLSLAGCGGDEPFDGSGVGQLPPGISPGSGNTGGGGGGFTTGVFQPAANFKNRCAVPRSGTNDVAGTVTDQNNWLRSWTNDTYLWYSEVVDRDPSLYPQTSAYFDLMRTTATTASGQQKDKFHFTYDTDDWIALSQGGVSASYGASFEVLAPTVPRRIVVGFVEPNSPAFGQLQRGDTILQVDGHDAVNGNFQGDVDALNAGLFPDNINESHVFIVRDLAGTQRTVTLTSASVTSTPVLEVSRIDTPTGDVGYILFNDHIATAEPALRTAITSLRATATEPAVSDLILDLRYNGGGYLDIASEAAYMVANTTLTSGQTFERLVFNSKHPSTDPVTNQPLTPTPFHSTTQGFVGAAGVALPTLNLSRVYIITGPGTCSASESIINSLRGVNVQVYLIGSTTCGKPYGFYPTDNCGTTYFSIQFRGENDAGFGDYSDGFSPANTAANAGTSVPGCSVADDFTHELGDPAEGRVAAALAFRASNNQTCPAATGLSDPRLSKASFQNAPDRHLWVSKPAARMNRILRRAN
jgi:carboxyl-terminal processing protease